MSLQKIVNKKGNRRLLIEICQTTGNIYIYTDDFNFEYFKKEIIKYKINSESWISWRFTDVNTKYVKQGIVEFEYRAETKYRIKSPQVVDIFQEKDKIIYFVSEKGIDKNKKQEYTQSVLKGKYKIDGYLYNRLSDNEYAFYRIK